MNPVAQITDQVRPPSALECFGAFVARDNLVRLWHTRIRGGTRKNTLSYIVSECVRGCVNHDQSHSLLSSPLITGLFPSYTLTLWESSFP